MKATKAVLPIGLILIWLGVVSRLVDGLNLHLTGWLVFIALHVAPGFLLGEIVAWRLKLDWLEKLALAFSLSVVAMAPVGLVTLLAHLTVQQLAAGWVISVVIVILGWLAHLIWVRGREKPAVEMPRWRADEFVWLILLLVAFVLIYPVLAQYRADGDFFTFMAFVRDALTGNPINAVEPLFGADVGANLRVTFNQYLPLAVLRAYFAGVDPIDLTAIATRPVLAFWSILAAYALGKAAGRGERRFGLLVAAVQLVLLMSGLFLRPDSVSSFFFQYINTDKFAVTVIMLPVIFGLAIRYVQDGERGCWLTAALATLGVSTIHPLIAAMLALGLGSFGALHALLNLRRRQAWLRVGGLALLTVIVMVLPVAQLLMSRGGTPMAPTFPSTLDGWSVGEKMTPVLPAMQVESIDWYGPVPDASQLEPADAEGPLSPFLVWRFVANMGKRRLILFDLNRYISDPGLVWEPPYLLAFLLSPLLLWKLRRRVAAQFALATTAGTLFVMYNPLLTPLIGSLVIPWILWRFVWLLPYALIIALALRKLVTALALLLARRQTLKPAAEAIQAWAPVAVLIVAAILLRPLITVNLQTLAEAPASYLYPAPQGIIERLEQETAVTGPVTVMANQAISVAIPAYVANANVVGHRALTVSETFPADRQDEALQRLIDQNHFFNSSYLTDEMLDSLRRYAARLVITSNGSDLDIQLRLAPQWFEWLLDSESYSLYAVRALPDQSASIAGNTALAEQSWDQAVMQYTAALDADPADLLALLGLAETYQIQGQFEAARDRLLEAADLVNSPAQSAALDYRLGQVYGQLGDTEASLAALDRAQQEAPDVSRYHMALGDACLSAGQQDSTDCAVQQYRAAVDHQDLPDEAARLTALAGIWQQRGQSDRSLDYYRQAAEPAPTERNQLSLVRAYEGQQQFEPAEAILLDLEARYPLTAKYTAARADLKSLAGDTDQAITLLEQTIRFQNLRLEDTTSTHLSMAQILLAAGRYDQAEKQIEQALALQPNSASAYTLQGNLYQEQNEPQQAIAAYQRALELDPTALAAYSSLSNQYRRQAVSPEQNLELLQTFIQANPDQAVLFLSLGDQLRMQGHTEAAISTYQLALDALDASASTSRTRQALVRHTRALVYGRLGAISEDQGRIDAAMNYLMAATSASPSEGWSEIALGDALLRRNRPADAEAAYRRAMSRDPNAADAALRLASLAQSCGDTETAIQLYDQIIQQAGQFEDDEKAQALVGVGRYYDRSRLPQIQLGSDEEMLAAAEPAPDPAVEEALSLYTEAFGLDQNLATVRALASLHQDMGRGDEAVQLYQQNIERGQQEKWTPVTLSSYHQGLGNLYLEQEAYAEARQAFEQAAALDKWAARPVLGLGRTLAAQGDTAGALAQFEKAVSLAPGSVEAQLALADALEQQEDEQALDVYQETALAHPGNAQANLALALALQQRQRWDEAEASYRQALAMTPGNADAYVGLAGLYTNRTQYAEAGELLDQARVIAPNDSRVYRSLGRLLARQARYQEALTAYQRAIELRPESWQLHTSLADVHKALGDIENAIINLKKAVLADDATTEPLLKLATLYQEQDRATDAETTLLYALQRSPKDAGVRIALADLYSDLARDADVLEQLRLLVEENPDMPEAQVRYANALRPRGREQEASDLYETVATAPAPGAEALQSLAQTFLDLGRQTDALALIQQAISLAPDDARSWAIKGQIEAAVGHDQAAIASLQQATELNPTQAETWHALGSIYLDAGEPEQALRPLQQALLVEPAYLPAYAGLLQAYLDLEQFDRATEMVIAARITVPGSYLGDLYAVQLWQEQGQWDSAQEAADAAISKAPGLAEPLIARARLAQRQQDTTSAIDWYRQALVKQPGSRSALLGLADLLLTDTQSQAALDLMQEALARRPTDSELLLRAGRAYNQLGQYAAAEAALQEAIRLDPQNGGLYAELGTIYLAEDKPADAVTPLEKAIELRPDMDSNYLALAQAWSDQNEPENALLVLHTGLEMGRDRGRFYASIAAFYLSQQKPELALETLQAGIEELGQQEQLMLSLERYYMSQSQYAEAESALSEALALYPDSAPFYADRGELYLLLDRPTDAVTQYQQAVTLTPDQVAYHVGLGDALQQAGDSQAAIAAFEQALVLDQTAVRAYLGLADVFQSQESWEQARSAYDAGLAAVPDSAQLLARYSLFELDRENLDAALTLADQAVQVETSVETLSVRARVYRQREELEAAIQDLQQALTLDPQAANALLALGDIYQQQNRYPEAADAYQQVIALAPKKTTGYLRLGDMEYRQQHWQAAWDLYQAALAISPDSTEILLRVAQVQKDQDNWAGAATTFRRVVEIDPSTTQAYIGLASLAMLTERDRDTALYWLWQGVAHASEVGSIYRAIGDIYKNSGQSSLAAAYYWQAIDKAPSSPEGYMGMAALMLAEGLPRSAANYAWQALNVAPEYTAAYITLGNVEAVLGNYDQAITYYHIAGQSDITDSAAALALGDLYDDLYRYDEAIAAFKLAIALDPADGLPWLDLSDLYAELGRYDEAFDAIDQAEILMPGYAEPILARGDLYLRLGDRDNARVSYERAQQLFPERPDPLLRLDVFYEQIGELATAEEYVRLAITLEPRMGAAYTALGRVLNNQGRGDEALVAYRTAFELDPRQFVAYQAWVRLNVDVFRRTADKSGLESALLELQASPQVDTVWAQMALGMGYLELENASDRALSYLERVRELDPVFAELHQQLALVYEERLDGRHAWQSWYRFYYATARQERDHLTALAHISWLEERRIQEPADASALYGWVAIVGTAKGEDFQFYKLEFRPAGSTGEWFAIGDLVTEPVEDGQLGVWDTTLVSAGEYDLRLTVVDTSGNYAPQDQIRVQIPNQ